MITKINATVLFVRDLDACVKFYRDILGFKVKESGEGYISFDLEGQALALMDLSTASKMTTEEAVQPEKEGAHRVLLAAFVDDTDEVYEALKSKGAHFIKPPVTQPWGQRTAYFKDPEGNVWEISHFLPTEKK